MTSLQVKRGLISQGSKICKFFTIMFFLTSPLVMGSELVLKDGRVVDGKIIEKTSKYIKLDIDGGLGRMTYYFDEIDTVDGQKFQILNSSVSLNNDPLQISDNRSSQLPNHSWNQVDTQSAVTSVGSPSQKTAEILTKPSQPEENIEPSLKPLYKTLFEDGYSSEYSLKIARRLLPIYEELNFDGVTSGENLVDELNKFKNTLDQQIFIYQPKIDLKTSNHIFIYTLFVGGNAENDLRSVIDQLMNDPVLHHDFYGAFA